MIFLQSHQMHNINKTQEAASVSKQTTQTSPSHLPSDIMQLQKTIGNQAVMQLLNRRHANRSAGNHHVIQRVLSLDNADFSGVTKIQYLGGAEGAYLVSDGSGEVVVKIGNAMDSTVMAYNLAKDFGIKIPSSRYLELNTGAGAALIAKAAELNKQLEGKLKGAEGITMSEYVEGDTLKHFKNKGLEDEKVSAFRKNPDNFVQLGRMLVFDAAILNGDRFKLEGSSEANSGNLMIANNRPVGIDQDFAHMDEYSTAGEVVEGYGPSYFAKNLTSLLSDPKGMAAALVKKMVGEGYVLFKDMDAPIALGIGQGIEILKGLADKGNLRLEKLIAWSKTFKPDSDLEADKVREYWNSLIG